MKKTLLYTFYILACIACSKPEHIPVQNVPIQKFEDLIVPTLEISTSTSLPVSSKNNYVSGRLKIVGVEKYVNFNENIEIKGRGNYTWTAPKKPYHIKLENAKDLFGFGKDKDYILLANYLDFNHILNATGLQIAKSLEMPYTPDFKPVEIVLNGSYQGLYLLTEQIEKEANRVNIGNDGALIEFDSYYNDPVKFKSALLGLPINVKYVLQNQMDKLQTDFNALETSLMSENGNLTDLLDVDACADFFIMSYLTDNQELNHPKSVFMYKSEKGKFALGPAWDFDWAFSFNQNESTYFNKATSNLFWSGSSTGTKFFSKFLKSPIIKQKFKTKWQEFRIKKFDSILYFVDEYAKTIEKNRQSDLIKWNIRNRDYPTEISKMKTWLANRALFIDKMVSDW